MIDIMNVVLILCLIACLLYIYWLYSTHVIIKTISDEKNDKKKKPSNEEIEEISFLKSNYDMSLTTKEDEIELDESEVLEENCENQK
jgi:Ca2+/Na+ antiporter